MDISPIQKEYTEIADGATYSPSDSEREITAYVKNQFDFCERNKRQRVRDAWQSLNFWAGNQWLRWDDALGDFVDRPAEEWERESIHNWIRPAVEAQASKSTENQPALQALPATDDDDSRAKARACDAYLDHYWQESTVQIDIHELAKCSFITGTGYLKVGWDPEAGDLVEDITPEERQELDLLGIDPDTLMGEGADDMPLPDAVEDEATVARRERRSKAKLRYQGAVDVEVCTVLEIGIEPGVKRMNKARWAYHVTSKHLDAVHELYPDKAKFVKANHCNFGDALTKRYIQAARGLLFDKDENRDHVWLIEYWERPSRRYPRGLYAVVAGDVLLDYEAELPFGQIPLMSVRHLAAPGSQYGDGTVRDLVRPQISYNEFLQADEIAARTMSQPKVLAPEGALQGIITNRPGQVINYKPTMGSPTVMNPPAFSPVNRMLAQDNKQAMREISGVSDIVFGQIPAGMSGRAIGFWQEQVASALSPTVREIERAVKELGTWILRLERAYGPAVRALRIIGVNSPVEVKRFTKEDIASTDVHLTPNSMLPKHLNYKREQLIMLAQSGMLGAIAQSPDLQKKWLKAMEFGDLAAFVGDNTRERSWAREENDRISDGEALLPLSRQDHATHIDAHLDTMNSVPFRLLPPEAQQMFDWHLAWHYYFSSMLGAGQAWWTMQAQEFPTMPPNPQEQAPAPGETPQAAPVDAFGPDPEAAMEAAPAGPDMAALLGAAGGGQMDLQPVNPQLSRAFPDMAKGPGVGDTEQVGG